MNDDAARAAEDYDAMAAAYADDVRTHPINAAYERPAMLAMAGDVRGRRVLDVGCAAGAMSALLADRGAAVVGVDVSERLVEIARRDLGDRAEFHVADVGSPMPFLEDESFDLVTASLVLHYLRDWAVPLREFQRVLRPGGALLISTHHPTMDVTISDPPAPYFEVTLLTDTWHKGGRDLEVQYYRRPLSAVVDALAVAGFLIERIPEPRPDPAAFVGWPGLYERISGGPWFLFIRAVRRGSVFPAPGSG
jgi:ubiquinone/menaquinone biosynthesis C-methylase UbiE